MFCSKDGLAEAGTQFACVDHLFASLRRRLEEFFKMHTQIRFQAMKTASNSCNRMLEVHEDFEITAFHSDAPLANSTEDEAK
jgi:hypothetical protein